MTDEKTKFQILFVDNSKTIRLTMAKILEKQGYTVDTAGTGTEAIEKAKTGAYEVIVMDLFMPMLNGYEAAKKIRELVPSDDEFADESEKFDPAVKDIPIIALTASNKPTDADIAKDNGMNDFVVKSADNQDLFNILKKYFP